MRSSLVSEPPATTTHARPRHLCVTRSDHLLAGAHRPGNDATGADQRSTLLATRQVSGAVRRAHALLEQQAELERQAAQR